MSSLSLSGSHFQMIGLATENVRRLSVMRQHALTFSNNHSQVIVLSHFFTMSNPGSWTSEMIAHCLNLVRVLSTVI